MFYYLSFLHIFSVFHYISFRFLAAIITSLSISILYGKIFIKLLKKYQIKQIIRIDGPQSHNIKKNTPTMGGILIIGSILFTTLLWSKLNNFYICLCIISLILFSLVGFADDYLKLKYKNSRGIGAKYKYFMQSILALIISFILYFHANNQVQISLLLPFFKHKVINLGFFYIILNYFTIIGSSNAVNLTDGLDGLVIVPVILISCGLAILSYIMGNINLSNYLLFPYLHHVSELTVLCGAIIGSGMGFLWFNCYPAQIFMGDIGSLSLGAILAIITIIIRHEILFLIMSLVLIIETISVILQVTSYKLRNKKRIFLMAPLHHHFELQGIQETKIITRVWIINAILVILALATLKLS